MRVIISENKIRNVFFNYLRMKGLDKVMPHGNGIYGCYYPIEWYNTDDELDYEPAPCVFVCHFNQHDYSEYHNLPKNSEVYSDSDFPLIELDWTIHKQMMELFGEKVVDEFAPEFFSEVVGDKIKKVVAE